MKVFSREALVQGLRDHPPYESNPDLKAKLNFIYFSPDGRMAMAYYESPGGWFDVQVKGFDEIDFVIDGEVELKSNNENLIAKSGACFLIQDGDNLRWQMNGPAKMVFFIYSQSEDMIQYIAQFKSQWTK